MVNLVRRLPFDERIKWTRPSGKGYLLLPFLCLRSGLLMNESPPLTNFNFYAKGDGKKELCRKLKN